MKRYLLFFIFIVLFIAITDSAFSQTACPPNIDFETGGYTSWQYFTGMCCPISATVNSGQIVNRHELTSGGATDPYGLFPIVAPGGGTYSFKLGNSSSGSEAEKIQYQVHVPASVNNYSLVYRYAVVFEDPGHPPSDQPRFEVRAFDSATGVNVPCAQYLYIAGAGLPGFQTSPISSGVLYKDWTTATLDLSGLAGKTITVEFQTGDCGQGGHFGYGYVDISCGLFQIFGSTCVNAPTVTLDAPAGFANYQWYTSNYSTMLGTGQTLTIPSPNTSQSYNVVLTPYVGFGCPDTLTTYISVANFNVITSGDTTLCIGRQTPINSVMTGNVPPNLTYSWTPSTGLSCSNCPNPTLTVAPNVTEYILSVSDTNNCIRLDTVYINPVHVDTTVFSDTMCVGDSFYGYTTDGLHIDTLVNYLGCDSFRFIYITIMNGDTTITKEICDGQSFHGYTTAGIYTDTFSNIYACDSVRTIQLTVNPVFMIDTQVHICQGDSYFVGGANQIYSGTYYNAYTSFKGCDSIWRFDLVVTNNLLGAIFGDTLICEGDSTMLYAGYNYPLNIWSTGVVGDRITVRNEGFYSVACSNDSVCFVYDTVFVKVDPLPTISIQPITEEYCRYENIELLASGATSYKWYLNGATGHSSEKNPFVHQIVAPSTKIAVMGTDAVGCSNWDSTTVFYANCCGFVRVPNAFTPNSDNKNDVFRPITNAKKFESFRFEIFNRWGKRIFLSKDMNAGWNGNYNGVPCELGTYFYQVRIKCLEENNNSEQLFKGDFILMR